MRVLSVKAWGKNRRRSSLLLFQRIKNFIFHFFCLFIRIFFFLLLLVRVKRNPFYSGLWILARLNENVHIYQERLCYGFHAIRIFYSLRITTAASFRHSSKISKKSVIPVSADRWQACFCTRLPSDVKLISPNAIRRTFIRVMPQQSGPVIRAKFFWIWRYQENRILKYDNTIPIRSPKHIKLVYVMLCSVQILPSQLMVIIIIIITSHGL